MRRGIRSMRPRDFTWLVGWLYADLLLGLFIIFLAATPPAPEPPLPTPTAAPNYPDTIKVNQNNLATQITTKAQIELTAQANSNRLTAAAETVQAAKTQQQATANVYNLTASVQASELDKLRATVNAPTPTLPPTPTMVRIPVLDPGAIEFDIRGFGTSSFLQQLDQQVHNSNPPLIGRRVGVMLITGGGNASTGTEVAKRAEPIIKSWNPDIFGTASARYYYDERYGNDYIQLALYVFSL